MVVLLCCCGCGCCCCCWLFVVCCLFLALCSLLFVLSSLLFVVFCLLLFLVLEMASVSTCFHFRFFVLLFAYVAVTLMFVFVLVWLLLSCFFLLPSHRKVIHIILSQNTLCKRLFIHIRELLAPPNTICMCKRANFDMYRVVVSAYLYIFENSWPNRILCVCLYFRWRCIGLVLVVICL